MNYGRYNRSVTVLSEQGRDFAAGAARVTGYLKIETGNNKGAMRCSVENLRPYPKGEYLYKLIFFGSRGERTIHAVIGTVPVGRSGNGEAYFRFNPMDVDGKGNSYEYFSTAIVASVSMRDDQEPLHPVLKGNTGNEAEEARPWAASIGRNENATGEENGNGNGNENVAGNRAGSEESEETAPTDGMELCAESPAMNGQDRKLYDTAPMQEPNGQNPDVRRPGVNPDAQGPDPNAPSLPRNKAQSVPGQGAGPDQGTAAMPDRVSAPGQVNARGPKQANAQPGQGDAGRRNPGKRERRSFNRFYNEHVLHACIHTCQVAEYYEEVKPFSTDKTGARWKKIMNITNLPLVSPGAHYFASLYHHYLFGARPDDRGYAACYFFAIPGRRLEAEQPDGGRSGFVYWQPMKGMEGQKNPYGYWIVEIDGQTGDIREVSIEKDQEM